MGGKSQGDHGCSRLMGDRRNKEFRRRTRSEKVETSACVLVSSYTRGDGVANVELHGPEESMGWLKTRYLGVDRVRAARIATLRRELEGLRLKEGELVDDGASKVSGLVSKLRGLGHEIEEEEMVRRLLDAMPNSYLQVVTSIEQCFDLDSMLFDEVVGRLKSYEERRKSRGEKEEEQSQLLMAEQKYGESSGRGRGRGRGYGRGERGRGRGTGRGGDKSRFRCFNCGAFGHFGYECTKWKDEEKEANLIEEEEPTLL
ncbi:putative RNA-directed DNA polymerase [Helianthus annuus]|nr:putative RNA-directed DNA polymerase [Helianthus annuus]